MLSIKWLKHESMVQTILNGSMSVGLSPIRDPGCRVKMDNSCEPGSPPLNPAAKKEAKSRVIFNTQINTDKMLHGVQRAKWLLSNSLTNFSIFKV